MNEMIERVARAIAMADPTSIARSPTEKMGDDFWEKYREHYLPMARAAIEAMREPTDAMVRAAEERADECGARLEVLPWEEMIDEALKDPPK